MILRSILFAIVVLFPAYGRGGYCVDLFSKEVSANLFKKSLTEDFNYRDSLPETYMSPKVWDPSWGKWGPWPIRFPRVRVPEGFELLNWAQNRVEAVAKKYIGLPYKHRHIPSQGGLDCSNFTSWVYNYGLGIHIKSNVEHQSLEAGRLLAEGEPLQKGDLLFSWNKGKTRIAHVVIYLGQNKIIDSSGKGVEVRKWKGWRRNNYAWARRVIEHPLYREE